MRAREVGQFGTWLETSSFSDDRLWNRPLSHISELEVQLFYARAGLKGQAREAREAIDQLQSELLLVAMQGGMSQDDLRLIAHEVPRERFTVEEFVDRLVRLNQPRRMAVLMALATRSDPGLIARMEWRGVRHMTQVPDLAAEILKARAKLRHMRLPYVFWEWATDKIAAPLLRLQEQAESVFDAPWPAIQAQWTDMIWVDGRADASSLLGVVGEIRQGKL
jgi:hypothetical protein